MEALSKARAASSSVLKPPMYTCGGRSKGKAKLLPGTKYRSRQTGVHERESCTTYLLAPCAPTFLVAGGPLCIAVPQMPLPNMHHAASYGSSVNRDIELIKWSECLAQVFILPK